jgi:hypothetical protein
MLLQLIMLFLQLVSLLIIICDVPVFYVKSGSLIAPAVKFNPINNKLSQSTQLRFSLLPPPFFKIFI